MATRWSHHAGKRHSASTSSGPRIRKGPRGADQRDALAGTVPFTSCRQSPRHRIDADITPSQQISKQPRDAGQPAAHRPRRQTPSPVHQPQRTVVPASPLNGEKSQHVRTGHPRRLLTDHAKEHHQVISNGQQRVRPCPHLHKPQIIIQYRNVQAHHRITRRINRTRQHTVKSAMRNPPSTHDGPERHVGVSAKITRISSMSVHSAAHTARAGCGRTLFPRDGRRDSHNGET
jgi:hypothetical protein